MKKIIFSLSLLFFCHLIQAQDYGLYWKYKDYDGAIAVSVPDFLMEMGSWFIDEKDGRSVLQKVNKARVLVFSENQNPVTERDMRRFNRRAKRRHLEELLMVRQGKTQVHVMAKERRKALRKLVILVNTPEEFALVTVKGNLRWDDISKIIDKYGKDKEGKNKKPLIPDALKIPVKRV